MKRCECNNNKYKESKPQQTRPKKKEKMQYYISITKLISDSTLFDEQTEPSPELM